MLALVQVEIDMAINIRSEIVMKLFLCQIMQIKDGYDTDNLSTMTQKIDLIDSCLILAFVTKKRPCSFQMTMELIKLIIV
jgi:hypothetical protein